MKKITAFIILCLCLMLIDQKVYGFPENYIGDQIDLHLSDGYARDIEKGHRPNRIPSNIKVNAYFDTNTKVLTVSTSSTIPIQIFCYITERYDNVLSRQSALVSKNLPMTIKTPLMYKGFYCLTLYVGNAVYCGVIKF